MKPKVFVALALPLVACTRSATPAATNTAADLAARTVVTWSGTATYEARHPTPSGASAALERRPARRVEVVALNADGATLATTSTGDDGSYTLNAPRATAALALRARIAHEGFEGRVSPDSEWEHLHEVRVAVAAPGRVDLAATDTATGGPAGAFHIADSVLRGIEAVKAWTGRALPPLSVYWGRGVTSEWSFYRGERPARSGRYMLELMGGNRGRQHNTDCDEHDEGIILHELGHFVMDRLSTNSSPGGTHPSGYLLDPGLAWEEGRATWFSAAVRREPTYQDTIGIEPQGSLRVDHQIEPGDRGPRGIGSEGSVTDILWDLTDGLDGYPDADNDGVAIGPAPLLRVMMEFNEVPGAYPCLGSFLQRITEAHGDRAPLLSREELRAMLRRTGQPTSLVDEPNAWPIDLAVPGEVRGRVDGMTTPAPSGGPPRGGNGFDAMQVYRVHLTQRGWLRLELRIDGTGRAQEHSDVDLELRDMRGDTIASSAGLGPEERLARLLEPGWYVIYVRDGGDGANGNRAGYTLRSSIRVLPPAG